MERVGGDVLENISNFVDEGENGALVLEECLEFRSDKLQKSSISKSTARMNSNANLQKTQHSV